MWSLHHPAADRGRHPAVHRQRGRRSRSSSSCPRLAGAHADDLASRYVGQSRRRRRRSTTVAVRLGFTDPICVQYGRFVQGHRRRRGLQHGPGRSCTARRRASATPSSPRTRCCPDLLDRLPVTLSLAVGAAVLWLVGGVSIGVLSALRRGQRLRPRRRWASRWPASRCRSSSPACCRWRSSATSWADHRARRHLRAVHGRTRCSGRYDLILPWITLAFLYAALYARLTRAGMLETMGEDYIRTARAKGLPERTVVVKHGLRAALTPIVTIFGLDLGLLLGGAILTESTFSLPGHRQVRGRRHRQQRPARRCSGVTLVAAFFIVAGQPGRRPRSTP